MAAWAYYLPPVRSTWRTSLCLALCHPIHHMTVVMLLSSPTLLPGGMGVANSPTWLPSGVTVEGGGGERPSLSNLSLALAEGPQAAKKRVEKSGDPRVSADGCLPS
jgi:hypothetical protein